MPPFEKHTMLRFPPATRSDGTASARAQDAEQIEQTLLAGIVRGVRSDFDLLYRIYYPRLTRFLLRMTGRAALSEELLDDTLLLVWQRAAAFNGTSKVSTWIFGIAYRKALKALSRLDDPVAQDSDAVSEPDPLPGPPALVEQLQRNQQLIDALAQLSVDHRAVVELCYFQNMDYREIAAVVHCPVDTVKSRMFYARRRLKSLLVDADPLAFGEAAR